jgi:hypothetical protein
MNTTTLTNTYVATIIDASSVKEQDSTRGHQLARSGDHHPRHADSGRGSSEFVSRQFMVVCQPGEPNE